ncbi:MAG: hypothetical protein IT285_14840 [Bdellovibrionales bacterium]|nr:hypothetical protein [Bdellovibrionales bacterium]
MLVVKLNGSIEESVDFNQLIGETPKELHVNCRGVPRINSVGVKSWIRYFQAVAAKGVTLKFVECSTAIVEQINLISNFTCGGEVVSIFVPFMCEGCKSELIGMFQVSALKQLKFELPTLKCSKCGGQAVFDDIPEEYFNFLMN